MIDSDRKEGIARLSNTYIDNGHPDKIVYHSFHPSLKRAIDLNARGRVIDIGCGNKPYNPWIMEHATEHIGCDIIQSSLNKVDIICSSDAIPLQSNSFDTAFCTQVIEHVERPEALIAEAFRLLKPGGRFILSGPMYWRLHEEPYDFTRFTKHGFKHRLESAGFKDIKTDNNGGKWAVVGQALAHCLHDDLLKFKGFKARVFRKMFLKSGGLRWLNSFFIRLDEKYYDPVDTLNYVVVAKKPLSPRE